MKFLLSLLLSILLLQSQVFALSGGPDYTRGGKDLGLQEQNGEEKTEEEFHIF